MLVSGACTGGPNERATPPSPSPATTTIVTLPPVGVFTYPSGPGELIVQIRADADGPVSIPLLTVYGDGRAVAAVADGWLEGRVTDLELQEFLDDAHSVGLLDDDLVLRGVDADGRADIEVEFAVDGRRLLHQFDLARIERPIALRAFLVRAATDNVFGLTAAYEPPLWINCTDEECATADAAGGEFSRPVLLPYEDLDTLAAEAGIESP